jgi:hypothetical protein
MPALEVIGVLDDSHADWVEFQRSLDFHFLDGKDSEHLFHVFISYLYFF